MKSVIKLDIPEYQIGQEVSVYFKDTMMKKGITEIDQDIDVIEEFENLKSKILNRKDEWGKYPVCKHCIEFIDERISELKGDK